MNIAYRLEDGTWAYRPMTEDEEAAFLLDIEEQHRLHPVDKCDLFRTPTGKCTCGTDI